jgi:HAD superfamily hydrolase (TIGR01450 family)
MSRPELPAATIDVVADWTRSIDTVLCDLDGVVWLAHQPIAGSADAVAALRRSGRRVLFVTNNSAATLAEHEEALARVGISASGDVVSSAMAVTPLVQAGERVLAAAGPGVVEALERAGAEVVVNTGEPIIGGVDAVVVGLHRDFDYDRLAVAADAARSCGRLIGTNSDTTYPTPQGLLPGGGSILAAVASASGVEPTIAGKPHQPLATLVASMLSTSGGSFEPERVVMIGDRPETDGLFAARLGCRFVLVRSGVSGAGVSIDDATSVDLDVADLAAVARCFTENIDAEE